MSMNKRARFVVSLAAALFLLPALARAQQKIDFTEQTLPNGLHVIYAPLHNAPVVAVHVRTCSST
jgi:hypothetical protein